MPTSIEKILNQRTIIDKYLFDAQPTISTLHLSSIVMWMNHFEFTIEVIDEALCVFAHQNKSSFLYWPPLGKITDKTITKVFERMNAVNRNTARIENINESEKRFYESQSLRITQKANEYIYVKDHLFHYMGNAYRSQRHEVNRITKNHTTSIVTLSPEHKDVCMGIFDLWAKHKEHVYTNDIIALDMLHSSRETHAIALEYMHTLGLSGILVLVDDAPEAYSLGYPLNQNTFVVLLEVCNPEVLGLSALTFSAMCQQAVWKPYAFVNAMDDFGLENIAHTKRLYQPEMILPVYNADQLTKAL